MTDVAIRMIKPEELTYKHPKKPFMDTSTSEVYKGEYNGFTVVIKRYTEPVKASPRSVLHCRRILNENTRKQF